MCGRSIMNIAKLVNVCLSIVKMIKMLTNKFLGNFSNCIGDSNWTYVGSMRHMRRISRSYS